MPGEDDVDLPSASTPDSDGHASFRFDFKHPDYDTVFNLRSDNLARIRREPDCLPELKAYYGQNPWDFINDWGVGYDPRNVERGLPALIPLVLFPKQIELCKWVVQRWKNSEPGIVEKSRDFGVSTLMMELACTLCLFVPGFSAGFGSRKKEYVDDPGEPKSLFFKGRTFMQYLPPEFRGNWDARKDAPQMMIKFPDTSSIIGGEAGDNIGRGDRRSMEIVDESAHLERPELIDRALASATNCRIDVSSVNGMGNSFATRRHEGKIKVFTCHWRDDPRKDDAWYAKQCEELDPVTVAQEIDINYLASTEGALIPTLWINAAIDADKKLGFKATGAKRGALDVADGGKDRNAFAGGYGIVLELLVEWRGQSGDIYPTVVRAHTLCDDHGLTDGYRYDADGVGSQVKGDSVRVNEERRKSKMGPVSVSPFLGSGEVLNKGRQDIKGRMNEDTFVNRKAQAWWELRTAFQKTYRAVVEGQRPDSWDDLIVIRNDLRGKLRGDLHTVPRFGDTNLRDKLVMQLAQITYQRMDSGKFKIDKKPDNMPSPDLADAVMMWRARGKRGLEISPEFMQRLEQENTMNNRRRLGYGR